MRGRSRLRTRGRTGSNSLLSRATALLGTAPLHYWDFTTNRALFNGVDVGAVTATPNWSFTRATVGTADDLAGNIIQFALGEIRRTNKGVLIEGAATNLTTYSEDLSNAAWTKTNASVVSGQTSPTGAATAYLIKEDTVAGVHLVLRGVTSVSISTVRTLSFYVKAAGRTRIRLYMFGFNNYTPILDISTQSVVSASGGTAPTVTWRALAGGFYRVEITDTTTAAELQFDNFGLVSTGTTFSYTGDGVSGVVAYGFQNELGAFASSYIPTTTASATRAADVLTVSSPGVTYPLSLFVEFERASDSGAVSVFFEVDDNTNNERAALTVNASDLPTATMVAATVAQSAISIGSALAVGVVAKLAGRFALNDAQAARGGALGTADTVATLPVTPTFIRFGEIASTGTPAYGYIRRAAIFNTALADAALQRATT